MLILQLDKALRDFLLQMRSPCPERDPDDHPDSSDAKLMVAPPVAKRPAAAVSSGGAAPVNAGQNQSQVRAEQSQDPSSSKSPSATESAAFLPAGEPANAVKPALASKPTAAPAQYSASQAQAGHQSQQPAQDVAAAAAAAAATQASASGAVSSAVSNSRHDAAQQTVAAAEDGTPIKVRRFMTDHQSTQTPRAHASPCRLSCAPPGREPKLPFASWADISDGLPSGHDMHPSPGQRADAFPSNSPFKPAAGSEAPFRTSSTEQQYEYEEPGLSAGQLPRQSQGVSHEQSQGRMHADEQHLEQMPSQWLHDGQRQAASQQQLPQQLQGHGPVPAQAPLQGQMSADQHLPMQLSDLSSSRAHQLPQNQGNATDVSLPASLPPYICHPAHSRAEHAVCTAGDNAQSVPSQAAAPTASSDAPAAAVHGALQPGQAARPMHNIPDSAAAAAAVRALQQSQIAGLQAQPSPPYVAMPSLPLCGPQIPMPEPQQHPFSHARDERAHDQGYHQQLAAAPSFGESRPMMDEIDGSWRAVAEHEEERVSGGVGSAPEMPRRQAQTPAARPRLTSNGKAALSVSPAGY